MTKKNGINPKHSKLRGELAELRFMTRAAELGLRVIKPWGDSARYDFVVETGGRFFDFAHDRLPPMKTPAVRTENPVNCCTMGSFPNFSQAWQNSFGTASTTRTATSVRRFVLSCPFKPSKPSTRACRSASARWSCLLPAMIRSGATASSEIGRAHV